MSSKLIAGWLWRPLVGASLSQVVLGIVRPTASYGGLELGADGFAIGVIAASFAIVPMILALPLGRVAGSFRHIGLVPVLSGLILAAACLLAASAGTLRELIVASALLGVGNLGVLIGAQSWISRSAPPERYSAGFGWMTAGMSLGQAVGPLLAGWLIGSGGPRASAEGVAAAFWAAGAVSILVVAVFASGATRSYEEGRKPQRTSAAGIMRVPGVARHIVVSAAVLTAVDLLTAYLPVLGTALGISPLLVGVMLAVRGASSTASRLLLGVLSRRYSQSGLIVASVAGAALSLGIIALVPVTWVIFAALAVGGFFLGLGQPLTMTAVAMALPAPDRSSGLALRLLGNRVAQTAAPLLAGTVTAAFGVGSVFLLQLVVLTASGVWELAASRQLDGDGHAARTD